MRDDAINKKSLALHKKYRGKLEVGSKIHLQSYDDLSMAYTPGVAEPCRMIAKKKSDVYKYTMKSNMVAVITDGTAVLGLGDIGPEAGLPVMEGKCVLFKRFAGVDAFPICIDTKDTDEFINIAEKIVPGFGAYNLEDISAPRCFEIERRLKKSLDIPVVHDDQHGTAIVVLAGLMNALKVVGKKLADVHIAILGSGAAGSGIAKLLIHAGSKHVLIADSKGIISNCRSDLTGYKKELADLTESKCKVTMKKHRGLCENWDLDQFLTGKDVFIGVSRGNLLNSEMVSHMNKDAILFAMANPAPEIYPDEAKKGGAKIIATGRSDFPNQVNNVLAFPGLFRGILDHRLHNINAEHFVKAAKALASAQPHPTADEILPSLFTPGLAELVAKAIC